MTNPLNKFIVIFGLFILINFSANAKNKVSFEKGLALNAGGIKHLDVDVGSGSLKIKGADVNEIIVEATIESKAYSDLLELQEAFEDKMIFSLEGSGSKATLKAVNKKTFNFKSPNIQVNLDVTVPNTIDLFIDDGSGSMKVYDINGQVEIDDGSGSMVLENIIGDVLIDDGSGSLKVSGVDGNVIIDDGSGSMELKNILGDLTVDDGSGSINVDDLSGTFKLIDGGSGKVYVNGQKWTEDN
ncbi:MAG: hypothetical protein AB8B80_07680 [Marinicellaceae bacterium]